MDWLPKYRKEDVFVEKYSLDSDEGIILRTSNVAYKGTAPYAHELILTNKNIILLKKGLFGGTKDVLYFPLNQVKVVNGKVQALVGRHRNGEPRLELYMQNGDVEYFTFQAITKAEAVKWAKNIQKILMNREEGEYDPASFAIPGTEMIVESIKGTMDTIKGVFNRKTPEEMNSLKCAVFCPNCGASVVGIKGTTAQCPYCGTIQNIP